MPTSFIAAAGLPAERTCDETAEHTACRRHDDLRNFRLDLVLDDHRHRASLDGGRDERVTVAAHSFDRDEHVARFDLARIVLDGAHLAVSVADQTSTWQAVDELAKSHAV
jgi:hypothetical protein